MSDEEYVEQRSISGALLGVVAVALLAALGGLAWSYGLQNHLAAAEQKIAAANQKNAELSQQLEATNARLRATSETLGQSVGMTQKQLELRAQSIIASQKAESARLEQQQAANTKQIGAVSSDVASVKTDVGGVKTDVATTKSDLEATKTQLTRVMGDAGVVLADGVLGQPAVGAAVAAEDQRCRLQGNPLSGHQRPVEGKRVPRNFPHVQACHWCDLQEDVRVTVQV